MKVDQRSAMILSSGVSICGVSACITAARVAGGDDKKLSYIVSLVLIIVVPMTLPDALAGSGSFAPLI